MEIMLRAWIILCMLAVAICNAISLCSEPVAGEKDKKEGKEDKSVRALKFAPKDAFVVYGIGGKGKLTRLEDVEAVEKLLGEKGKAEAKALAAQVDFKKDAIVLISWTTSGP